MSYAAAALATPTAAFALVRLRSAATVTNPAAAAVVAVSPPSPLPPLVAVAFCLAAATVVRPCHTAAAMSNLTAGGAALLTVPRTTVVARSKPPAGCNPTPPLPSADTNSSHPQTGDPEIPLGKTFGGFARVGHVVRGWFVRGSA